ncbi:hypothetical protein [Aquimarina agarivorans]|uniref:hypothetical protein n=1 Tax=Aquimarina agarivorans TaxID=980584 RepID=UPI000248FC49|nr:hypothetical protein [Aquimarina agarivorans]
MQENIAQEVQNALTTSAEEIRLEQIQNEDSSPLNQPVIEKDIGGELQVNETEKQQSWNVWKPGIESKSTQQSTNSTTTSTDFRTQVEASVEQERAQESLDAPEQEINDTALSGNSDDSIGNGDNNFEVPLAQANQAADALLGMTNNVLAVGGGYFVKIGKHQEFYEFDEIIQVIEEQNEKNIQRIKLDKEDQALLRPLLAQVLRKKSKQLTPEQQLLGAIVSILMKKVQVVLEVRAENSLLETRILDIVREERADTLNPQSSEVASEDDKKEYGTSTFEEGNKEEQTAQEFEKNNSDLDLEKLDDNFSVLEVAEAPKINS